MRAIDLPYAPTLWKVPARYPDELKLSLDDLVMPGDILPGTGMQTGEISACRLMGGGVLATIQLSMQEVRHERVHLQNLPGDDLVILVILEGRGSVSQGRCTLQFKPGDITFRRACVPSVARIEEPAKLVMLRLPIARFFGYNMSHFSSFVPSCASRESGIVSTVHRFVESVLPSLGQQSVNTVAAAEQSLVSLLAAAYQESTAAPKEQQQHLAGHNSLRWSQLGAFISSNLYNSELDVESCANALGVSKRYIHKVFEVNGSHYGKFVLQQRLARSRDDLTNPQCAMLSIERIGYKNGFSDPAHFSRCFRAMFGVTPSAYRRDATSR